VTLHRRGCPWFGDLDDAVIGQPRVGLKVLSVRTLAGGDEKITRGLCADAHGFSLHAAVRCGADQRKQLEQLCRYITRPALANDRLSRNAKGQVVLRLKSTDRDGTTQIVMHPQEFMQRQMVLMPASDCHHNHTAANVC
jgi:hypothetical protein